jgi:hypothetical protein
MIVAGIKLIVPIAQIEVIYGSCCVRLNRVGSSHATESPGFTFIKHPDYLLPWLDPHPVMP